MNRKTLFIVKAGIIAGLYFVLTVILGPLGYGIFQVRLSEAMTILPLFEPAAIPGLFIGCLFANIAGSTFGLVDIVLGSLTTLLAAYVTSKMPNKYLGTLPPILLNAFFVSIWISVMSNAPYLPIVFSIGFGQFLSAGILGALLASIIERTIKRQ